MGTTDDLHAWDSGCIICIFVCGLCPLHRRIVDIDVAGGIILIVTVLGREAHRPGPHSLQDCHYQAGCGRNIRGIMQSIAMLISWLTLIVSQMF
jgi:hypothetical protein